MNTQAHRFRTMVPSRRSHSHYHGYGFSAARWFALPFILWAMLWLSINTGPWNLQGPWPQFSDRIAMARAGLPLVVLTVALLGLTKRGRQRSHTWAEMGLWGYGLVMLAACSGAENWFDRAYWGFAFLAALVAVEIGLRTADSLELATRLNWLSWVLTSAALVIMLILARDVLYDQATNSGYGLINRFQHAYGYGISRETGLSRMACIPAVISFVFLFSGTVWSRIASLAVFAGSTYIIWFMQSRGALFAFAGAFLFLAVVGTRRTQKIAFLGGIFVALSAFTNVFTLEGMSELWMHVTRGTGTAGMSTMSGRPSIWQDALQHWSQSPLYGFGPQADRLFEFNAQNALLYALLCAGLVGATFFVLAMASAWRALTFLLLRIRHLPPQERVMLQITGAVLVFSTLRSYPENQAAVFSVDLLLQYPAMVYLVVLASRIKNSQSRRSRAGLGVPPMSNSSVEDAIDAGCFACGAAKLPI